MLASRPTGSMLTHCPAKQGQALQYRVISVLKQLAIVLDITMAIYYLNVKTHARTDSSSNNAVRAAAYRSGSLLTDASTGNRYNYSRKHEVIYSEIRGPENIPARFKNREVLWSEVEKTEKRCDAQLFREIEVALPIELNQIQMVELLRFYLDEYAIKYGMIADFSIHNDGNGNPHSHISLTMREIDGDGFGKKNRDWNDKKFLERWRKGWEKVCNKALKDAGFDVRIDSRSYADQGIDKLPTIHEGREGIRGDNKARVEKRRAHNRTVREYNAVRSERKSAQTKIQQLERELAELEAEPTAKLSAVKVKMLHSLDSVSKKPATSSPVVEQPKTPEIIIKPETRKPTKIDNLGKLNKRILQSVQTQYSSSRAMVVYEAPEHKNERNGIDKTLCYNMPTNPMDVQACYSLRALLGKDADKEFNSRTNALHMVGMKYSWQAFYEELNEGINSKYGANAEWWRAYARMCFHEHRNSIEDIKQYVPDKYRTYFDEVIYNELKKSNLIPADQPKYAVWKYVRQVEKPIESKPSPVVNEPRINQPSIKVQPPNVPPRQQVDEAVDENPHDYLQGWQEPEVAEIPNTIRYPEPKQPWDSSGSDFSPF